MYESRHNLGKTNSTGLVVFGGIDDFLGSLEIDVVKDWVSRFTEKI
jgi:hypothetical protein